MAREDVDVRARFRFADALARGVPVGAAAKAAGYSRQQGWNLRNDPSFLVFLEKRRGELSGGSSEPAPAGGVDATAGAGGSGGRSPELPARAFPVVGTRADAALAKRTLRSIAKDLEAPAVARVAASKALIELARKPITKAIPIEAPVIKMLAPADDGDAAKKWLESQGG